VVADVEVPDDRAPLALSGIAIGSQTVATHQTLISDARLTTLLASAPTAVLRFARSDVLTAFVEA
jgi:hypothetical protein